MHAVFAGGQVVVGVRNVLHHGRLRSAFQARGREAHLDNSQMKKDENNAAVAANAAMSAKPNVTGKTATRAPSAKEV